MPKFRTKKTARASYIYRDAYGKKTELTPDMIGIDGKTVTADHIVILHGYDDDEHNSAKVDDYYGLTHYEQTNADNEDLPTECNLDLADYSADPETRFIEALDTSERSGAFKAVWDRLTDKQRGLVMKKLLKRTNVDIAAEEGITEATVRGRLTKLQGKFEKFLK